MIRLPEIIYLNLLFYQRIEEEELKLSCIDPFTETWGWLACRPTALAWRSQVKRMKVKSILLLSLLIQGRHSCEGDFAESGLCFQNFYNNGRWYFRLFEKAFPYILCLMFIPFIFIAPGLLFLHPLLPCKSLDVCDPFGCLIAIEKSKADRLFREQSSLYLAPFQTPSHQTKCQKPFLLEQRTSRRKSLQGAGRTILIEQRRSK